MLMLGEVHTGLLQNSTSLGPPRCEEVLGIFRGEAVRRFERPISWATSPERLTGVDCQLPTSSGSRLRGIGTVAHRATIVGGHVLQGAAAMTVTRGTATRRLPWSHYLARPGLVEAIGAVDWADLARGFVAPRPASPAVLDLGAISGRMMDALQTASVLDRSPPLRAARTKLRWVVAAGSAGAEGQVAFRIESRQLRTLRVTCPEVDAATVAGFCEDLALHDWLLTTLLEVIERSRISAGPWPDTLDRLRPAIDHLLHLWMPAARADGLGVELWDALERRSGMSRQWRASVDRIRDQVAISTMTLLRGAARSPRHD